MATIEKNLGIATAYGYAKSKGYTGTEEEFAQAMKDMTDAVDTAQENAENSEAWAVGKRNGTDVPSTDVAYHNNAKYYAEQIGSSASQIATNTQDIADLKDDLGQVDLMDLFEMGSININNAGWTYELNPKRVRTKEGLTMHLYPGDKIGLSDYSNARYYVGYRKLDGTYGLAGWLISEYTVTIEGYYVVLIANTADTIQTDYTALASLFYGFKGVAFDSINEQVEMVSELKEFKTALTIGYLNTNGTISQDNQASLANKSVATDFIPVEAGDVIEWTFTFSTERSMWFVYWLYDSDKKPIGTRNDIINSITYFSASGRIAVNDTNASYIRLSYRTFGEIDMILKSSSVTKMITNMIEDVSTKLIHERYIVNQNVNGVNHRGFNTFPENTLQAFKESRKRGFACVETDVRFTSDGVPVLLHDASINRTARNADGTEISGTINIADITYAESQTYDFGIYKGAEFEGIKLPKYEDFLKLCKNIGLSCYIELKAGTDEQIQSLVQMTKNTGMDKKVTWISFSSTMLTAIKNYDETARIGFIVDVLNASTAEVITGLTTGKNEVFADASYYNSGISSSISYAKANGIPIEVWTVDNETHIIQMDPYITGVTSNNLVAGYVLFSNSII